MSKLTHNVRAYIFGFLKSPESKMLGFPGLESPGKGIGPGKPWKSPEILK